MDYLISWKLPTSSYFQKTSHLIIEDLDSWVSRHFRVALPTLDAVLVDGSPATGGATPVNWAVPRSTTKETTERHGKVSDWRLHRVLGALVHGSPRSPSSR